MEDPTMGDVAQLARAKYVEAAEPDTTVVWSDLSAPERRAWLEVAWAVAKAMRGEPVYLNGELW